MLRLNKWCYNCGSDHEIEDVSEEELHDLSELCPKCKTHNIYYQCAMDVKEFLTELSEMTNKEISKYAIAIQFCASELLEDL